MSRRPLLLLGLSALACNQVEPSLAIFEGPTDAAILPEGGVFDVNVAFVTNAFSGEIALLDLTHEVPLADHPYGWWIRGMPIAAGKGRYLDHIAVYASDHEPAAQETFVTLFTSDAVTESIVVVPYLDSAAQIPAGYECVNTAEGVVSVPPRYPLCFAVDTHVEIEGETQAAINLIPSDGSSALAVLRSVDLNAGFSTTERWQVRWRADQAAFEVEGTQSGVQTRTATVGEEYRSDNHEIGFTIDLQEGELTEGDHFEIVVDSGVREIPVGGVVEELELDAASGLLLAVVQPLEGGSRIVAIDPGDARTRPEEVQVRVVADLPDARVVGMDLVPERRAAYFADASELGRVHALDLSAEDPDAYTLTSFEVGFPTVDVALSRDPERNNLFLARADVGVVQMLDVATGALLDTNPFTPEVDGIDLGSPLKGIGASLGKVEMADLDNEGAHPWRYVVVVSTYSGNVYTLQGDNGCAAFRTPRGAYAVSSNFLPAGGDTNVALWQDSTTLRSVTTSACGGVTRSEVWTLQYDALLSAWRVEGTVSGEQERLVYSNQRYVSDGGEISVLILDGTLVPSDGDTFRIETDSNLAVIAGSRLPQDPVLYEEQTGQTTNAWFEVESRQRMVLMIADADTVSLVDMDPNLSEQVLVRFQ